MASSTVIPQIGSLLIDFDSFMVVILSLLLLLNLDFLRVWFHAGSRRRDTKMAESEAHACAVDSTDRRRRRSEGAVRRAKAHHGLEDPIAGCGRAVRRILRDGECCGVRF